MSIPFCVHTVNHYTARILTFCHCYQYLYLFRFVIRKNIVTVTAITSAAIIEYQMPSIPQINGRIITAALSNNSVRRNEISAEVNPSFSAVKNAEPKMEIPANRKAKP